MANNDLTTSLSCESLLSDAMMFEYPGDSPSDEPGFDDMLDLLAKHDASPMSPTFPHDQWKRLRGCQSLTDLRPTSMLSNLSLTESFESPDSSRPSSYSDPASFQEPELNKPLRWSVVQMAPNSDRPSPNEETKAENRRSAHIHMEQRRRAKLRDLFSRLEESIPDCVPNKSSKARVLELAVAHLKQVHQMQHVLLDELQKVKSENERLKALNGMGASAFLN